VFLQALELQQAGGTGGEGGRFDVKVAATVLIVVHVLLICRPASPLLRHGEVPL
jgi:hypothetical protein